ncbi:hypothetical protein SAMN05444161_0299 [Rhizobiales bacterium GAS191]|nr:hypothetical protein SAMN05444161_0299 [Rhizobiales bacterium GAS191]
MFSEADLEAARAAGVLDEAGYLKLKAFLAGRVSLQPAPAAPSQTQSQSQNQDPAAEKPRFDVTHVLWYTGALLVMTAMGMFSTTAFAALGGGALTVTGLLYAAGFLALGNHLWGKNLRTPGGLAIAVAVSMVPLSVYGIQDAFDMWGTGNANPGHYRDFFEYIRGGWVIMEVATVIAALLALRFWPFPFIVFVGTFALWFMSMDLAIWFTGGRFEEYDTRREVSMFFGLAMILVAWLTDLRRPRGGDFAFWLHLFGVMCFWGGLSLHASDNNLAKALYCLINIGLIFLGVFLGRRVYAVFGTIGIMLYLGDLSWRVFDNVLLFSFALSGIGVGVIALGLLVHRNEARLAAWMARNLPPGLSALRPAHARVVG